MTKENDIKLIRYCRDNNSMEWQPLTINEATGEIEVFKSSLEQTTKVTRSELWDACDYVEDTEFWTLDKAIELTGVECFGTQVSYCMEHELEELKELCNVALCIRNFEKTIGYAE